MAAEAAELQQPDREKRRVRRRFGIPGASSFFGE
jgi:hypothetical protein